MGLSDSRARTQSKTLIYSLCCVVAQTHYFLLILFNFVPIGRIIIILLYLSIFSGVVFPDVAKAIQIEHQSHLKEVISVYGI